MGTGTNLKRMLVGLTATGALLAAPPALAAPAPTPAAPAVTTGAAKSTTATSATLTGTVNPEGQATTYHFQYGLTTSYGSVTPSANAGSGTKNSAVAAMIASLTPNTTYHYRLVATNATGTTMGADRSFKTAKAAAFKLAASPSTIVFGQTTRLSGKVTSPGPVHTTVTLQTATSGTGPFTTAAITTSSSNGAYSFVQKPGSNTFYRAVANGVTSAPVRVAVRFRVTLFVSTTHPRSGQRVRFHGSVAPAHNGFRVRIQRLGSDGRWHTLARPLLHQSVGNSSAYSTRIRVRRSGRYRATVAPDAHNARGFSRLIRIQVH
jgi:hypothetical protein